MLWIVVYVICFFSKAISENLNQLNNRYESREELVIDNVTSYNNFELGSNVLKWKSITLDGENYAIGLMATGLCIFTAHTDSSKIIISKNYTDTSRKLKDVDLFKYWNTTLKSYEVITVLATNTNKLEYYKILSNLTLHYVGVSEVLGEINYINAFTTNEFYNILVLTKNKTANLYTSFINKQGEFNVWLSQVIPLESNSKSSTIVSYGSSYFLAIPQLHTVWILKKVEDNFLHFTNISSHNVDTVTSFNIDFKSFLLINGQSTGIYRFYKEGLVKQTVENTNLDGINFWLPAQLPSYKNDIILLGQRLVDHDTFKSKKIELIVFSGHKFFIHEEMPCKYYGDHLSGIDCIVEEDNQNVIINGSAVLIFNDVVGIVVPKERSSSGLFLLHMNRKEIPNPFNKQIEKLKATKGKLEKMLEQRRKSTETPQRNIKTPINTNISEKVGSAKINQPTGQSVRRNSTFTRSVERSDLVNLEDKVNTIQRHLDEIKLDLQTAVRRDSKSIVLENLFIDDIAQIKGNTKINDMTVNEINELDANKFLTDFVRKDDSRPIASKKTFDKLDVEKIVVAIVNEKNVSNMYFKNPSSTSMHLNGNLRFLQMVEIEEDIVTTSRKINELDLSKLVLVGEHYDDELMFQNIEANAIEAKIVNKLPIHNNYLSSWGNSTYSGFDQEYESLYVPQNVTATNINGENLDDILNRICFKNLEHFIIGDTEINGDVHVTEDIEIKYLNGLKYPEEYVSKYHDSPFIEFTGNKYFANEVTANEITARNKVNGINTDDVISLSENQTIPGIFTFANLDVTESLKVDGNITGVKNFLKNPTIKDTKVVNSNVHFKTLEVEGIVLIGNTINGTHLEKILEDVVFKDEEDITITSVKDFKQGLGVTKDLKIKSNSINGVPLNAFVDKFSEQTLENNIFNGNVTFENLLVVGLFGKINITQLDEESVKLSGEQFISSTLNFNDEILVNNLNIKETLNGLTPIDYYFTTGNRIMSSINRLKEVNVNNLIVEGNFYGKIGNFDIEEFDRRRISISKDQEISGTIFAGELYLDNLDALQINNYSYNDLFDSKAYHRSIVNMILENKVRIKELKVTGNVTVHDINNIKMDDIMSACVYGGQNQLASKISFRDNVQFNSIAIDRLNGILFDEFIANLIFKNETDIVFDQSKYFVEGIQVYKFIETDKFNEALLENILRKTSKQDILGPISIKGNVSIQLEAIVSETINEIPVQNLGSLFEVLDDGYKIHGEVSFSKYAYAENVIVQDRINSVHLPTFFEDIVGVNDDIVIPGETTFTDKVNINGDLGVMDNINGIDLSKFFDDVIFLTYDTYIQGLVSFAQPVEIKEVLIIESDLLCKLVMGIDIRSWKENAVFINEGYIQGKLHFESVTVADFIKTDFINSINMSTLIPLRTHQYLPEGVYIEEMSAFKEIQVDNLVNGIKLQPEFFNTVLSDVSQELSSELDFTNNVVIHSDLIIGGLINNKNMTDIVTTNSDQILIAEYNFNGDVIMHSDLITQGYINIVNVSDWKGRALIKSSSHIQTINNQLTVDSVKFENNVLAHGLISGLNMTSVADQVEGRKIYKESVQKELLEDYDEICLDINHLLDKAKTQMYNFKYFDYRQVITFYKDVGTLHHFMHQGIYYMLINGKNSCKSALFSWSFSGFSIIEDEIETGIISQLITVRGTNNSLYLVGTSEILNDNSCPIDGTNIWKFEGIDEILLVHKLSDLLLLQDSKIPGTFYGFNSEFVFEFNITSYLESSIKIVRKWKISNTDNLAFMPHDLETGLMLRDGYKLINLAKEQEILDDSFEYDVERSAVEDTFEEVNAFVPGRNDGDFVVFDVGKENKRTLTAVATHEEAVVKGKTDFVKIYEDILNGIVYYKIPTYKPSSLVAADFGKTGESLLIFLEDQKKLQVYKYRGLEGFKLHSSIKEEGQNLFLINLPTRPHNKLRTHLGIVNNNKITLLEAIMDGDTFEEENLQCVL